MNDLSWLFYAAEVSERIGGGAGALAFFAGLAAVFVGAGYGLTASFRLAENERDRPPPELVVAARRAFKWVGAVFLAAIATYWFMPSKDTLMLIAASEVGETVLASKDVQAIGGEAGALASDSLKLLRKYVTDQLGEEAE